MNTNEINVWPSVQQVQRSHDYKFIKIKSLTFHENPTNVANNFWEENFARFFKQLENKKPKLRELSDGEFDVDVTVNVQSSNTNLTMETNEEYNLQAFEDDGSVKINISSESIFGGRHGLETLIQMIFYDDFSNTLVVSSIKKRYKKKIDRKFHFV